MMAMRFSNAYLIVVFACCREIFLVSRHCGGISLSQVEEIKFAKKVRERQAIEKLEKLLHFQVKAILNKRKQFLDN